MCTCPHLSNRSSAIWCVRKSDLENKVRLSNERVQPVFSKYSHVDSAFTTHRGATYTKPKTFNILLLMYMDKSRKTYRYLIRGYFRTFLDYNHIRIGMIFHIYNHINQSRLIYRPVCPLQMPDPLGRRAVKTGPGDLQAPSPRTRAFKSHPPPTPGCPAHVIKHQVKMLTAPDGRERGRGAERKGMLKAQRLKGLHGPHSSHLSGADEQKVIWQKRPREREGKQEHRVPALRLK